MASGKRIHWVDTVKALGMFLVFYGHFIEMGSQSGNEIAFTQFKFIYSFHMPLFFILSGFFFKSSGPYLKKLFLRRLVPVLIFGILFIPLWIFYFLYFFKEIYWTQLIVKLLYYLKGHTEFNLITWFLVCLFTCEVLANFLSSILKSRKTAFIFGIAFLLVGWGICDNLEVVTKLTGIGTNTWYVHESIVALGFYLLGYSVYPIINRIAENKKWEFAGATFISSLILILTYNRNTPYEEFVVMMINSNHGSIIPFLLAAFAGSFLIISIGILLPANRVFSYVGQNTIILLGLNGVFHHFINNKIVLFYFPGLEWHLVTLYSIIITIISIAVCYPSIQILNFYLPQLMGKSYLQGPLLPNLENVHWRDEIYRRARVADIFFTKFSENHIKKPNIKENA